MTLTERLSVGLGLTAVVVALLALGAAFPLAGWTVLLCTLLGALVWTDATTETVPDVLTVALVACGLAYTYASGAPVKLPFLIAGLLIVTGVLHGRATGDEGWIGSGDFFLIAGIVAWFGPVLVIDVLAIASILLLLHGIIVRSASIPLAPSLAASASLIWFGGPLL